MIESVWGALGGLWTEKQLYGFTENVIFIVKLFLTVTFVFSSNKIDL